MRTGDVGFIDEDGFVTLRGRRAELIEVNGVTWFPRDIEEALQRIPGVRLAALIGLPDAVLGARPAALSRWRKAATSTGAAIEGGDRRRRPYDLAPLTVTVVDAAADDADRQDRQGGAGGGAAGGFVVGDDLSPARPGK